MITEVLDKDGRWVRWLTLPTQEERWRRLQVAETRRRWLAAARAMKRAAHARS